jgi:hypothetical protein
MRRAIRVRHYSIRTEEAYLAWIRRFFAYTRRHPRELSADEINRFLTDLAVRGKVAASTQQKALSAITSITSERSINRTLPTATAASIFQRPLIESTHTPALTGAGSTSSPPAHAEQTRAPDRLGAITFTSPSSERRSTGRPERPVSPNESAATPFGIHSRPTC